MKKPRQGMIKSEPRELLGDRDPTPPGIMVIQLLTLTDYLGAPLTPTPLAVLVSL